MFPINNKINRISKNSIDLMVSVMFDAFFVLAPNQSQQMAVPEPELRIYKQIKQDLSQVVCKNWKKIAKTQPWWTSWAWFCLRLLPVLPSHWPQLMLLMNQLIIMFLSFILWTHHFTVKSDLIKLCMVLHKWHWIKMFSGIEFCHTLTRIWFYCLCLWISKRVVLF